MGRGVFVSCRWAVSLTLVVATAVQASARPDGDAGAGGGLPDLAFHGFVSQGAFLSTENDFLGHSERGSVEFLEAAINVSTEVTDRLRIGAQLFTRDLGPIGNYALSLDWAYLDYRLRDWLGLRAGRIKMPFGLYNEFSDIDAARLPILLPQSVYPIVNRDFLLAQTGFALYGALELGRAGGLDYQLFGGTMFVDPNSNALVVRGPVELRGVDTDYAAGGQLFWRTPRAGLRVGASYLHTNLDFQFEIDRLTAMQLVMAGLVPPDFDGSFEYEYRPMNLAIGSLEYARGDWLFAAEYSRWIYPIVSSIPDAVPGSDEDSERFYAMLTCRLTGRFETGAYYSILFVDAEDRDGSGARFSEPHRAYRKDLAVSARFDVTDSWLWKLEGHYIDGTAELTEPDPEALERRWGLFLVKTTVTF